MENAPARVIGGLASSLSDVWGLALDGAANLYASSAANDRVVVFPAGADGNATPKRVLTGTSTQMDNPFGIWVGSDRRVTLSSRLTNAVNTYAPLVALPTAPSAVRSLAVSGKAKAKKRTIRWVAPASNGGATIVRYDLVVKKGAKTIRSARLAPSHRSYVLKTKRLKKGGYTAFVRAVNSKGASAYVAKAFRIRK